MKMEMLVTFEMCYSLTEVYRRSTDYSMNIITLFNKKL